MVYIIPFPFDLFLVMAPALFRGVILHYKWKKLPKKNRLSRYEYKFGPIGVNYKKKEFWTIQIIWAVAMFVPVSR